MTERPEQVELLLDGQRPQVLEQRRPAELRRSTSWSAKIEVPVVDVAERRQRWPRRAAGRPRPGGTDHVPRSTTTSMAKRAGSSRRARRNQKRPGRWPPVGVPLGEQQGGDQVAADHEEHVDAEEAARQPGGAVVGDDRGDGEGPQAVDPGHVRKAGSPRRPGRAHAGAARSRRGVDPASVISRPSAAPWVRSRQTLSRVRRGRDGSCPARPGVGGSRQSGRVCGARSG